MYHGCMVRLGGLCGSGLTLALNEGVSSRCRPFPLHRLLQTMLHTLAAVCTPGLRAVDSRHSSRGFGREQTRGVARGRSWLLAQRFWTRTPGQRYACFPRADAATLQTPDPQPSTLNPIFPPISLPKGCFARLGLEGSSNPQRLKSRSRSVFFGPIVHYGRKSLGTYKFSTVDRDVKSRHSSDLGENYFRSKPRFKLRRVAGLTPIHTGD